MVAVGPRRPPEPSKLLDPAIGVQQYVLALPADRSVGQDSAAALGAEDLGTRRVFDPAIRAQEDLLACLCGQSTDDATRELNVAGHHPLFRACFSCTARRRTATWR